MTMQRVPINDAQNEFHFVMNQVCTGLGPVLITGFHGNAVLVSEAEWRKLQRASTEVPAAGEAGAPEQSSASPTAAPSHADRA
jgi:prevent-host-death family protein